MAAGITYTPIATTTTSSSVSDVTFSSISGSYTDLIIIIAGTTGSGVNIGWQANGDTGTNYSYTSLWGNGTSAGSFRESNISPNLLTYYGYFDGTQANIIAHFMNYANTTTFKTVISRANNTSNGTAANVGLWRSTSAINSIKLIARSGTFSSGTTLTLYGITAA